MIFRHLTRFLGAALLILASLNLVSCGQPATQTQSPTRTPVNTTTRTPLPPNAVGVSIVTNDTKAEWLKLVTDAFNKAQLKTARGRQIVVDVLQESSPQPTVDKIVAGEMQPTLWSPADISWVEQANQRLQDQGKTPVVGEECPRLVYAATGFAMWRPMAEALGWPDQPIGWQQLAELAGDLQGWAKYGHPEWGQFKFGHAHPEQSSTGMSMLTTLAYAAAGKTAGLSAADVRSPAVGEAFRKVELDTFHYGTSTSRLLNLMIARGPSYLHAVTASETATLYSNTHSQDVMRFPFAFIFPADGTFWQDNPACLLTASWVTAEQREAAQRYRDYLLAFEQQDMAVQIGLRPAVPGVPLHAPISLASGTDPRVSPQSVRPLANVSAETQQAVIDVFKETKKKATVYLVLDRSGSMAGEKLSSAAAATRSFVSRLAPGDRVTVTAFDTSLSSFGPAADVATVRAALSQWLNQLQAGGNTALNDAVCAAVQSAEAARTKDRESGERRLYGIVVLSDGVENRSKQKDVFACLPTGEDVEGVKVFTIAYGQDADANVLKKIAERTNGKTFSGDPKTIEQVYLAISAEQ